MDQDFLFEVGDENEDGALPGYDDERDELDALEEIEREEQLDFIEVFDSSAYAK